MSGFKSSVTLGSGDAGVLLNSGDRIDFVVYATGSISGDALGVDVRISTMDF